MFQLRKPVEHSRQHDFAEKARAAQQEHRLVAERIDGGNLTGTLQRSRIAGFVFSSDGVPSPVGKGFHQWALAVMRNGGSFVDDSRNSRMGQFFSIAIRRNRLVGFVATGWPTADSIGTCAELSEKAHG